MYLSSKYPWFTFLIMYKDQVENMDREVIFNDKMIMHAFWIIKKTLRNHVKDYLMFFIGKRSSECRRATSDEKLVQTAFNFDINLLNRKQTISEN